MRCCYYTNTTENCAGEITYERRIDFAAVPNKTWRPVCKFHLHNICLVIKHNKQQGGKINYTVRKIHR